MSEVTISSLYSRAAIGKPAVDECCTHSHPRPGDFIVMSIWLWADICPRIVKVANPLPSWSACPWERYRSMLRPPLQVIRLRKPLLPQNRKQKKCGEIRSSSNAGFNREYGRAVKT